MRNVMRNLFTLKPYRDRLERRRVYGTYVIAAVIFVASLAVVFLSGALFVLGKNADLGPFSLLQGFLLLAVSLAATLLTRRGQQRMATIIILVAWMTLMFILSLSRDINLMAGFAGMLVAISISALLISERAVAYTTWVTALLVAVGIMVSISSSNSDLRTLFLVAIPIGAVHVGLNYSIAKSLHNLTAVITRDAEERSLRLNGVSSALAERLFAARLDLGILLHEAVKLVKETFSDVEVAQLYLVDRERRNATLMATTALSGRSQLGQQIGVGSLNVIGRVTIGGQSVIVRDSGEEQAYRRTAFLEGTRAELVIPLRVGLTTIGALDVHSLDVNGFQTETTNAIESLAQQIALAIENAQLFADTQNQLADTQRLYDQASASLREIERLNQQLTGAAWAEYLRGINAVPAFTIDPGTGRIEDAADWTTHMTEASRRNQVITRSSAQSKTIALPITVRGEVIGAMEFELPADQVLNGEQMAILQQVIERLGLAAENIRLLDEAQRIAQREAMVNEITARMQAATNVESVLATATQSIGDAFQAARVSIRLGMPGKQSSAHSEAHNGKGDA